MYKWIDDRADFRAVALAEYRNAQRVSKRIFHMSSFPEKQAYSASVSDCAPLICS